MEEATYNGTDITIDNNNPNRGSDMIQYKDDQPLIVNEINNQIQAHEYTPRGHLTFENIHIQKNMEIKTPVNQSHHTETYPQDKQEIDVNVPPLFQYSQAVPTLTSGH